MGKEDRKQILDKAAACVLRDRNATHGEAEDNFKTIADYWTTHLRARGLLAPGAEIAREDVAIMSAQIKLARLAQGFDHEDNWVDGAGYMACGGGCAADRRRAGELYSPPYAERPIVMMRGVFRVAEGPPDVVTDGNGMPTVTAPSPRTLGAKVFTGEELDDLRNFILARPLPLGQTIRGAWTSGDAEMLEIRSLGTLGDLRFLLKRGKTFAEIEEELHACLGPKFVAEYVDAKRKDARPENVHTKAPNLDNSIPGDASGILDQVVSREDLLPDTLENFVRRVCPTGFSIRSVVVTSDRSDYAHVTVARVSDGQAARIRVLHGQSFRDVRGVLLAATTGFAPPPLEKRTPRCACGELHVAGECPEDE